MLERAVGECDLFLLFEVPVRGLVALRLVEPFFFFTLSLRLLLAIFDRRLFGFFPLVPEVRPFPLAARSPSLRSGCRDRMRPLLRGRFLVRRLVEERPSAVPAVATPGKGGSAGAPPPPRGTGAGPIGISGDATSARCTAARARS